MSGSTDNVTQILLAANAGDQAAIDLLLPLVYDELRRIAARLFRKERPDHTLQPTALVHEAYFRLIDQHSVNWQSRAHFYGLASHLMRRVLLKHAERREAKKREGRKGKVSLDDVTISCGGQDLDLLALNEALDKLAAVDEQKAKIVELKFFGGLTTEEISEFTGISARTVERQWTIARGFLFGLLKGSNEKV